MIHQVVVATFNCYPAFQALLQFYMIIIPKLPSEEVLVDPVLPASQSLIVSNSEF